MHALPSSSPKLIAPIVKSIAEQHDSNWVRETRVGTWFLGTNMWREHVLPNAIQELLRLGAPAAPGQTILDIGCGEGFAFPLLARHFSPRRLIGIDIDPALIARGHAVAEACSCPVSLKIGNATDIDLEDGSVDIVFCHQTFHHLSEQDAAAREFFRVLAPGGTLLFAESCRSFIFSWWVRLFFRHPMEAQKSAQEYATVLRDAGFLFSDNALSTPYPEWSRPDFGLSALLGRKNAANRREPLVCVVARRPGKAEPAIQTA